MLRTGRVFRDTWEAAQRVGAEHRSSRDGAMHNPADWRTYPFRGNSPQTRVR